MAPAAAARLRREARRSRTRLRGSLWPAGQASIAAALSWVVAHDVLGHAQPFFAPIAALISVSTVNVQRGQRSLQMATGVLLGIAVGEAFASVFGVTAFGIGSSAFVTLVIAVALSVGVIGQGMMFVNQAGASAVLVVALHRTGTAQERLVDALVGGAMAVLIAVVCFPSSPLKLVSAAESDLLRTLARRLEQLEVLMGRGVPPDPEWVVGAARAINQALSRLAESRRNARNTTIIAPRRRRLREAVARENARTLNTDLLANSALNVIRIAADGLAIGESAIAETRAGIGELSDTLELLAATPQPWPDEVVATARAHVTSAITTIEAHATPRAPLVASLLREAERDILLVLP